jgi:hypothetical protein
MRGSGDLPGAPAYHADLTCGFGVKYVWRGRVTSVIGQDTARRLGGVFNSRHPLASGKTVAKEIAKIGLAMTGDSKYEIHKRNEILRPVVLRDGQRMVEFFRSNPCWGGISFCDTAIGIPEVLTTSMLNRLMAHKGFMILYTHLGKI